MGAPTAVTLAIRFLCEVAAVVAVAVWGVRAADGAAGWALGIGAALLLAVVWGVFVSPKARVRLRPPARLAIELAVWTVATAALVGLGRPVLAAVFALLAVGSGIVNATLVANE